MKLKTILPIGLTFLSTLIYTPILSLYSSNDTRVNIHTAPYDEPCEGNFKEIQLLINSLNDLFGKTIQKDEAQQIINHYTNKLTSSVLGFECESLMKLNISDLRQWIKSNECNEENINLIKELIKVASEDIAALN